MLLRRFIATKTADALDKLRSDLGDQALILSTHSEPDGTIVITAAVDGDGAEDGVGAANQAERGSGGSSILAAAEGDVASLDLAMIRVQLAQLARKVHRMDQVLLDLEGVSSTLGPAGREIAGRLVSGGLARHLAEPVARSFEREVETSGSRECALEASLLEHVAVVSADAAPRLCAFVGPTGGGKTTTIAKIAARHVVLGGATPGFVVADNNRIAAAEHLGAYARLLGAPIRVARNPDEMRRALDEFADRSFVLIDTAGLSGDAACVNELRTLLTAAGPALGVTAVVSATSSLSSLNRVWPQLAQLAPESCVVTKLDECDEPGTPCTWLAEVGLPLRWLGTGQRIPEDLVAAGAGLARWLVAA